VEPRTRGPAWTTTDGGADDERVGVRARRRRERTTTTATNERGRRTDFSRRRWNIVYVRGTVATTTAFVRCARVVIV
jgi:hypothetical protein